MKKNIILLLMAIMTLCLLVGCDKGDEEPKGLDKNDSTNYIGLWESQHITYEISKGGIGTYKVYDGDKANNNVICDYNLSYEIKDEVMVITIKSSVKDTSATLELNEDGTKLSYLVPLEFYTVPGEEEFTKNN